MTTLQMKYMLIGQKRGRRLCSGYIKASGLDVKEKDILDISGEMDT